MKTVSTYQNTCKPPIGIEASVLMCLPFLAQQPISKPTAAPSFLTPPHSPSIFLNQLFFRTCYNDSDNNNNNNNNHHRPLFLVIILVASYFSFLSPFLNAPSSPEGRGKKEERDQSVEFLACCKPFRPPFLNSVPSVDYYCPCIILQGNVHPSSHPDLEVQALLFSLPACLPACPTSKHSRTRKHRRTLLRTYAENTEQSTFESLLLPERHRHFEGVTSTVYGSIHSSLSRPLLKGCGALLLLEQIRTVLRPSRTSTLPVSRIGIARCITITTQKSQHIRDRTHWLFLTQFSCLTRQLLCHRLAQVSYSDSST
jgi:hypothetical protein